MDIKEGDEPESSVSSAAPTSQGCYLFILK